MSTNELLNLSNLLRNAAGVSAENDELRRRVNILNERLRDSPLIEENTRLKDEVNRLRIGHKELKEKAGNEKHRADMLEIALKRKNLEMEISGKEQAKTIIIQELKKHIALIRAVYGSDIDACLKLTNLVHQAM